MTDFKTPPEARVALGLGTAAVQDVTTFPVSNPVASAINAGDKNALDIVGAIVGSGNRLVGPGFDASTGALPSTGSYAGTTRSVEAGDTFRVSVAGTVDAQSFAVEDTITALKDAPSTSVYLGNWQIGKGSLILKAADIRPFLTEAAMLAATDVVANQRAQVAGREWIYKPLGTYTASTTVKNSATFQLVSTSLMQDCTFAEDTRTIAFLRSVYGSAETIRVSYAGTSYLLDLTQTMPAAIITSGGVGLSIALPGAATLSVVSKSIAGSTTSETLRGDGRRKTVLDGGGGTVAVMNGSHAALSDVRLQSDGGTLIDVVSASYFAELSRVWLGKAAVGIDIDGIDAFWWTISDMVMRDCDRGIVSTVGQDVNAMTIMASTFYHFNPLGAGVGYSLDLKAPNGLSLLGNHIQNQGWRINGGTGNCAIGGYWEAYDKPALDLTDTSWAQFGVNSLAGTRYKIDHLTAEKWAGQSPNISAQDSGGIERIEYLGAAAMPYVGAYRNVFPDPFCATQAAIDGLSYSPTGAKGAISLNASGNVEISFSGSNQRNGVQLPDAKHISTFVRWRAKSGIVRFRLGNTSVGYQLEHDSAVDSEWRYSYVYGPASAGQSPSLFFQPATGDAAVVEIDTLILADSWVAVRERKLSTAIGPVEATTLKASGAAAIGGELKAASINSIVGFPVTIAAGATETVYAFAGSGVYLVTLDQGTYLRTDQPYWTGRVVVGLNGALNVITDASSFMTVTGSGYNLQANNTGGSSKAMTMKAIKIA